jgi:uracil-DNA glycosylase family 4
MIVGEAPGEDEDSIGEPFVGRSGKLLNKLLTEANISREVIYITNSVRCRPPHNRLPSPEEISACKIWLWREIQLIQPKVIMPLGHVPSTLLLKKSLTMGKMKGNVYELDYCKAKLMPWYHPSYLLRQGSKLDEDTVKWFRKVKENL